MCNKCSICGVENDADRYNDEVKNKQLERKLCFNCLFWVEKAENQSPHALIDDSFRHMHAKEEIVPVPIGGLMVGCGGRRFKVVKKDGTSFVSNNLWHQGTIPEIHRHRFSPNLERIEEF